MAAFLRTLIISTFVIGVTYGTTYGYQLLQATLDQLVNYSYGSDELQASDVLSVSDKQELRSIQDQYYQKSR